MLPVPGAGGGDGGAFILTEAETLAVLPETANFARQRGQENCLPAAPSGSIISSWQFVHLTLTGTQGSSYSIRKPVAWDQRPSGRAGPPSFNFKKRWWAGAHKLAG